MGAWERAELDLLGCVAKLPLESGAWRHKHPAIVKQGAEGAASARRSSTTHALLLTGFFN